MWSGPSLKFQLPLMPLSHPHILLSPNSSCAPAAKSWFPWRSLSILQAQQQPLHRRPASMDAFYPAPSLWPLGLSFKTQLSVLKIALIPSTRFLSLMCPTWGPTIYCLSSRVLSVYLCLSTIILTHTHTHIHTETRSWILKGSNLCFHPCILRI